MQTITATVSYSVSVQVEVPDDATEDQKYEVIIDESQKTPIHELSPVITKCSDEELEE